MNRTELVDQVALATGQTKTAALAAIEQIFAAVTTEVKAGRSVTLKGFGTFEPRNHAARLGRNPRTGEAVAIPARTVMGFKPSKVAVAA